MLKRIPARLLAGTAALAVTAVAPASPVSPRSFALQGPLAGPFHVGGITSIELAGNPLDLYPHFEFVRTFFEGAPISIAVDPTRHPRLAGWSGDVFVVEHKDVVGWTADSALHDVRGEPQAVAFTAPDVQGNTVLLQGTASVDGDAGIGLGVPYDVVLDSNRNAYLDPGDWMDGIADEPGLFVVRATQEAGPLAVTEVLYSGGTFLGQDLYYPTDIATMGELPLVVVSHGNGHNYTWYDHVGKHLASYGCIVMSHQNNTGPGIETAATTTLTNTEYILANEATVASGKIAGHIDNHRILWFGHSRGARASCGRTTASSTARTRP